MGVRALWFTRGRLHLVDQRELPRRYLIRQLTRVRAVAEAIRNMTVRGAPAIGVTGAYGMALASLEGSWTPDRAARLLRSTRPTANDLFVGVEEVRGAWAAGDDPVEAAHAYRRRIVDECHQIGEVGAPLIDNPSRILTHCNAGALATVEWGTALAPMRVAHDRGTDLFVWVDETRPMLQGSRLTAWELARERIPHAIIADNAAGHFLHNGEVDLVLVGADRIAMNGDVANKVGTYEKAVVARENRVPFYVAAPFSTFDPEMPDGQSIPVEERLEHEVLSLGGQPIAPARSPARNPAFDVTPARYVTAFVTPGGIVRPGAVARIIRKQRALARKRRSPGA